jgi:hypothetical protein
MTNEEIKDKIKLAVSQIETTMDEEKELFNLFKDKHNSKYYFMDLLCDYLDALMIKNQLSYITVDTETGECDADVGITIFCDTDPKEGLYFLGHGGERTPVEKLGADFLLKFTDGLMDFLKD